MTRLLDLVLAVLEFEVLVPDPKVVADVLVFVHGLPGWWEGFWDTKQEFLRTETRNLDILEVPWTLFISLMEAKIYF